MSPLSTKYVARGCNIHGPSFHTFTRPSMVRCTLRNMALFFLVFICVSYVQHSGALQPYHHSGAVIDPQEDMDDFLLVEAHDEEEALPSFSPIRYTASPSGYIDDTYARLLWGDAGVQQRGFARVVSSALFEEGSMSQATVTSDNYGRQTPAANTQGRFLCDAIMLLASGTRPAEALTPEFKTIYYDSDVAIIQQTRYSKHKYSYSYVTGITQGSPYTQFIVDLAHFHTDFVAAYDSDTKPVSVKGNVKEILFSNPITLSVKIAPATPSTVTAIEITGGKTFSFAPNALSSQNAEDLKARLTKIQEYFNTLASDYYGSEKADFNSGLGIPKRVAQELAGAHVASKDAQFKIRAENGHYNVIKLPTNDVEYYKVGLDEIHRCMHQRINLVRAFCNPYTGAVNTGDFTKSTAFATDYMRIPTGQTILDYQIVVDEATKEGTVLVSTHISSDMTSKAAKINGYDITFQKFDYNKSPQFHVARTLAAFEWPVDVSPVVDQLTLPAGLTSAQLKTALGAPFVYDRMNGYLEELTSVARTVNPETIVNKLMAAVGIASNAVATQDTVKKQIRDAFTAQLKYPLGTTGNDPRRKIAERVRRKVGELLKDAIAPTGVTCSDQTREEIAGSLFNWMHERVKAAFDVERQKKIFDDSFTDILAVATPPTARR